MKMEKERGIMSDIVKVDKISMRFNMSSEIIHSFKEYIIKLLKRELFFKEFWELKNVSINLKKGEILELGAGFDPELTARENIFLNGAVLGYSRKFIESKFDEIVQFSELEYFLDTPLKNFSSGMYARLGFAIATVVEPDILIADEFLAVGDFHFQEKCEKKIKEMIKRGTSVLFVSHSIQQIEELCDRVVWLEKGEVKMTGKTKDICKIYKNS